MVNPGPGFEDGLTRDEDWGAQLFQAGLEFADNPEPRCPCVLLLDTSKSMSGDRIAALNQGLQAFRDEIMKDPLARQRSGAAIPGTRRGLDVRDPRRPAAGEGARAAAQGFAIAAVAFASGNRTSV